MEKAETIVEGAIMSSGLAKTAPVGVGVTVSGLTIFGVPLPDLVPLLTCIYLVVMLLHTEWKWWTEWKAQRRKDQQEETD